MRGKIDEAMEFYEEAIGLDKKDGRGWLGLSRCYSKVSNLQKIETKAINKH